MTREDVQEWIAAARKKKGWTQTDLGERMGVTKANVSHWETGKHDPSFLQLLKIRDLTGHPLQDVLSPQDWPFKNIPIERVKALDDEQRRSVALGLLAAVIAVEGTAPPEALVANGAPG